MEHIRTFAEEALRESIRYKQDFLSAEDKLDAVGKAVMLMIESLKAGNKILVFGNGGSASDSQHMAAELVVRFEKERGAIPAVALSTDTSILTAAGNDYDFDRVFSRQVEAIGKKDDIAFAISTSGNSANVLEAVNTARDNGLTVIALTGKGGGALASKADVSIVVEGASTARIQEVHGTVVHIICKLIEDSLA
jgi:D-sedoheptulose 7-phosphate isomerase